MWNLFVFLYQRKVNYNAISLDLTLDFRFIKLSYTYYVTDYQKQ